MTHPEPKIRTRLWRNSKLEVENFPFEQISDYLNAKDCLIWADICDPDPQQLQDLAKELALDPLAIEDVIDHEERTKATRYDTYMLITAYSVNTKAKPNARTAPPVRISRSSLTISRVSAFVMQQGVVTVRHNTDFDINEIVRRWDENTDLIKYGPGALVHGLLDAIVDGHFEAVQLLDDQMEALEDQLFDDSVSSIKQLQQRTYQVRKDLVELRRVVLPMREVVNAVLRHRQDAAAPPELNSRYDDLYDHVLRASEWTESLRDMVTTIFETNLSLQDSRLNMVMKKLTAWAAIIAVPTAVTGYFGQNIPYPGFQQVWGFYESITIMAGIAIALYITFKRKDWL